MYFAHVGDNGTNFASVAYPFGQFSPTIYANPSTPFGTLLTMGSTYFSLPLPGPYLLLLQYTSYTGADFTATPFFSSSGANVTFFSNFNDAAYTSISSYDTTCGMTMRYVMIGNTPVSGLSNAISANAPASADSANFDLMVIWLGANSY
jgi:hypothetical protein